MRTILCFNLLLLSAFIAPATMAQNNSIVFGARGDAPYNDECTGALPQPLSPGLTITVGGNNTGANELEGTPFVVVWEAFILEQCATVVIDHCLTGYTFTNFMNTITSGCPDVFSGLVNASDITSCSKTYADLPPGIWYVPVLVEEGTTPMGDYEISFTATACDELYCVADGGSQDLTGTIESVEFADIDIAGPALGEGYLDATATATAFVGTGSQYPFTVTLDVSDLPDGVNWSSQLLIWIDLDQDGNFEDAGELVSTSATPMTSAIITGTIAIPQSAMLGTTRMRIRLHDTHDGSGYINTPNDTPCGTSTYGQVVDLNVQIDLGTGLMLAASSEFNVYPNPTNGPVRIELPPGPVDHLEIRDATGRLVLHERLAGSQPTLLSLELGHLPAGAYTICILNAQGRNAFTMLLE